MLPNIQIWIAYANKWESGDTSTTGEAFESYGCLQNALTLENVQQTPKDTLTKNYLRFLFNSNHYHNYIKYFAKCQ